MPITLTSEQQKELVRYIRRDPAGFVEWLIANGDEATGIALVDHSMNTERHKLARQALDILWQIEVRNPDWTLGQVATGAGWTPPE